MLRCILVLNFAFERPKLISNATCVGFKFLYDSPPVIVEDNITRCMEDSFFTSKTFV